MWHGRIISLPREAPFSSLTSPYSRALWSAIRRKTSFIFLIHQQLEKEKSQVQDNLIPSSAPCEHTFTAHGIKRRRVGRPSQRVQPWDTGNKRRRDAWLSCEKREPTWTHGWKKPLEFHLLVSCSLGPDPEPPRWRAFWGALALRRSAGITGQLANGGGNHKSTRKWSHNRHWNNFRKAFHEAAGTENHYRPGLN